MNAAGTPNRINRAGLVLSVAAMAAVFAILSCLEVPVDADARAMLSLIALNLGLLAMAVAGADIVHPRFRALLDRAARRQLFASEQ